MKVTLIHNPSAGDECGDDRERLSRLVRGAGHDLFYCDCRREDWAAALEAPADLIAVAGGDGTLAQVAKRLVGKPVPIAALPAGTANNISRTLAAVDATLEQLVAGWDRARRVRVDVGEARGSWGSALFLEGVGLGLFAWTLPQADASATIATLDQPEARLAYAIQMLKERLSRYPAQRTRATLDGEDVSGDYVLLEAMNTQYIGPNLFLAPKGDPGDGLLDVITVTEAERERFLAYLSSWQKGWLRPPDLPCRQGRHLRIEWAGSEMHLDDTLWPDEGQRGALPGCSVDVRIGAGQVQFLAPAVP